MILCMFGLVFMNLSYHEYTDSLMLIHIIFELSYFQVQKDYIIKPNINDISGDV